MFYKYPKNFNELFNNFNTEYSFGINDDLNERYHSEKTDEGYIIEIPIPGLTENDLNVQIVKGNLKIENTNQDARWVTSFKREFILPEDIDKKSAKASVKNGVLIVKIGIKENDENIVNII